MIGSSTAFPQTIAEYLGTAGHDIHLLGRDTLDYTKPAQMEKHLKTLPDPDIVVFNQRVVGGEVPKYSRNNTVDMIYLDDFEKFKTLSNQLKNEKVLIVGVSYALLEMAEKGSLDLKNWTVMETGGMKGRRKEIIRKELHKKLVTSFNIETIHSEYGMTELLSQAYSNGNGIFSTPPWMKVLIRDFEDPFNYKNNFSSGGVNIIDLANIYSCSFIETQDIGKKNEKNEFEILGRFDNSEVRGCNLLSFN